MLGRKYVSAKTRDSATANDVKIKLYETKKTITVDNYYEKCIINFGVFLYLCVCG